MLTSNLIGRARGTLPAATIYRCRTLKQPTLLTHSYHKGGIKEVAYNTTIPTTFVYQIASTTANSWRPLT